MKASNLREQTDEELAHLLAETEKELVGIKARKGAGDTSGQPLRVRTLRRDVARMRTVLGEREQKKHG